MKKLRIGICALLLSGCVTTHGISNQAPPDEWNYNIGQSFTKKKFDINEYAQTSDKCLYATSGNNATPQQERYTYCMQNNGYELTALSQEELDKRKDAIKIFYEGRRYSKGKVFDKENFDDQQYILDLITCGKEAQKLRKQDIPPIYSPNATTMLFNSTISGISNAQNHRNAKRSYLFNCMFRKEYIFSQLPEEEAKRRIQLMVDAGKKT